MKDAYLIRVMPDVAGDTIELRLQIRQAAADAGAPIGHEGPWWVGAPPPPEGFRGALHQLQQGQYRCVVLGKDRADTLLNYLASLPGYTPDLIHVKQRRIA